MPGTFRTTRVEASANANATWRATKVTAEFTAGPRWRATRVSAEIGGGSGLWRHTRVAAEVSTSGVIPVADAGGGASCGVAELVRLDGTASFATGATITTYNWRLISTTGPTPALSDIHASQPTFRAPVSHNGQTYVFGLIVIDNNGLQSSEDQATVSVAPADLQFAHTGPSAWWASGILSATSSGWI